MKDAVVLLVVIFSFAATGYYLADQSHKFEAQNQRTLKEENKFLRAQNEGLRERLKSLELLK